MHVESHHTTWEFCCLVANLLNQFPPLELEVLRGLVILCCKNLTAHKARNERGGQVGSEEDMDLGVNMVEG